MKNNRLVALFLCLFLVLGTICVPSLAQEDDFITILIAAQKDGAFFAVPQTLTVYDGLAESYGYAMPEKDHNDEPVDGITFFDALVAFHQRLYGDDFTKENAKNYLNVSDSGFISKAFSLSAASTSFFINSAYPADKEGMGYSSTTAVLSDGDVVEFWFYQDTSFWSDAYASFNTRNLSVNVGESFDLTLYATEAFGCIMASDLAPVDGTDEENTFLTINPVENDGSIGEALTDDEGHELVFDENGHVTLSFSEAGTYIVTAQGFVDEDAPIVAPFCIVTVKNVSIPTSITIEHDAQNTLNGRLFVKNGDSFSLTAYDQDGNETPVTWKNTSYNGGGVTLDEATGHVEITSDIYSGTTSYVYFTATSLLDNSVSKKITLQLSGYLLSNAQKNPTVALSSDGQTAKTVSVTGGQTGHTIWSYDIPDGIASLAAEPENNNSIRFNAYRPGIFTASFSLDINQDLTDTATITVTGVAVEGPDGSRGKTYLTLGSDDACRVQLSAYVEDGRTINSWTSSDEAVATVDSSGLVTACGIGNAIIQASDDAGIKGGMKIIVESDETPYFESLEFATTAFASGTWVTGSTFSPTKLEYTLPIRLYSTSSLVLQPTTLYDTEKYTATAEYTNIFGEPQHIRVNSGASTTLPNQSFGESVLTITLADKADPDKQTIYTFHVSRPRDTTKTIKNNGIVLLPVDRPLSPIAKDGLAEGTMCRANNDGTLSSGTGVGASYHFYRTFLYDDAENFKINIVPSTVYSHVRYTTDDGASWHELAQGGGFTDSLLLSDDTMKVSVQILDDTTYEANMVLYGDGFADASPNEYTFWIDRIALTTPKILSAEVSFGDWYPSFNSDIYSYRIMVPNHAEAPVLTYTITEGDSVKIGSVLQTPDENGTYTLPLKTGPTSLVVTSADNSYTATYSFAYSKKSALSVPDKVVDYLCIGSQYTNANYGINPELTLSGNLKSLGNFGGYITYYYEDPITDDPHNKYGMDFYVIGNSSELNIDSMAELGQVYVSEDGETFYALAGSEHYEDKAIWDYTITYQKGSDEKAYWTDNYGNAIDYAAKAWPTASCYPLSDVPSKDTYSFTGVVFKSQLGTIMGNSSSSASYAAQSKFGYVDYYASNISGGAVADVNPYIASPSKANGFDLAWAVDENGRPIDVSGKAFHYIKIATASNIYAGAFAEKSTEVTYVVRTTPTETEVGKTQAPSGVTITDGISSKIVNFTDDRTVYAVNADSMKYISVLVNGVSEDDNVYVNNQRVEKNVPAEGFKVTKEGGETRIRIIVQNGDKEPMLYLLQLTGTATESDRLVEGIKINADGSIREAATKNSINYTVNVGYRIDSVSITPVVAPGITYTVNGEPSLASYPLVYGKNTFEIVAQEADGHTDTVTLTVTRDNAPAPSQKTITVKLTVYGDEHHASSAVHTYKDDKNTLPMWIPQTSVTVNTGSTVLDVLEIALHDAGLSFENDGGNYISEINGLAEFDNGDTSGWMYTVNGRYPSLGVAEQRVAGGDKIIFHYTDDYTREENSLKKSGGSGNSKSATSPTVETDEPESEDVVPKKTFSSHTFRDVAPEAWYYDAVGYVFENNLMQGSDRGFEPDSTVTRAMFITILYRASGETVSLEDTAFEDVSSNDWFAEAVVWGIKNNIVKGLSDSSFMPQDPITREQMTLMLYRFARQRDTLEKTNSSLSLYSDEKDISEWAYDAVSWAHGTKLIQGTSDTIIAPKGMATRAEAAAVFMRFLKK